MIASKYYETLGLEPGASAAEIKKAYFRLIRQFSPEKDPEEFQRIREAYERLKDMDTAAAEGPSFPPFSDPFGRKMMDSIERWERAGAPERARDTCEEARRYFPEDTVFLYKLVRLHRMCGNPGKAVKCAEELVKLEPENAFFQMELALSLIDRGWMKKALAACDRAYRLNCRNPEFLLMFAAAGREAGRKDIDFELLMPLIREKKRWPEEQQPVLEAIYMELAGAAFLNGKEVLPEIIASLTQAVRIHGGTFANTIGPCAALMIEGQHAYLDEVDVTKDLILFLETCRETSSDPEERITIDENLQVVRMLSVTADPEIHKWLKYASEGITEKAHGEDTEWDRQVMRFVEADYTLCLIQEREAVLPQEELLRERHPWLHEALKETFDLLKDPVRMEVKKKALLKTIRQLRKQFEERCQFEQNYPEDLELWDTREKLVHNSESDGTYIRVGKKIGRNDPCPCGSKAAPKTAQ